MSSWPDARCFGDVWTDAVTANPDGVFLRFGGPSGAVREWSSAEFNVLVSLMAGQLVERGAQQGRAIHLAVTVPVAFVVAADPSQPPTVEQLLAWCTDRLAKSKRPRDITFVDELSRTSVGKIRKFLLRDPTAEKVGQR